MLDYFPYMVEKVDAAENYLKMAIQYAMVGNYIDFGALENVNEQELKEKLDEAVNIHLVLKCWILFRRYHSRKRLVYLQIIVERL